MKNVKKMQPGCLYLFEGEASSSSCFIQCQEDAKSFIRLANRHLKDFLNIHEYNLTKDGWMMIVSLRSREKILKSYKKIREKSKTCNRNYDLKEIWKIISGQMKEFLKAFVKDANKRSGREGSLVKRPYKRSYFENLEEAKLHVDAIRKQLLKREQKLKKYRGRKKFFKFSKKQQKGHILLCTNWKNSKVNMEQIIRKIGNEIQSIIDFENLMASNIINRTLLSHT